MGGADHVGPARGGRRGQLCLIATHDTELIDQLDRGFSMADGRLTDVSTSRHSLRTGTRSAGVVPSGRSGIRTHGPLAGPTVFKTVAFVRSAILPNAIYLRRCIDAAANPSARALLP